MLILIPPANDWLVANTKAMVLIKMRDDFDIGMVPINIYRNTHSLIQFYLYNAYNLLFFCFLIFEPEFQTPHDFQPLEDWSDLFKIRF